MNPMNKKTKEVKHGKESWIEEVFQSFEGLKFECAWQISYSSCPPSKNPASPAEWQRMKPGCSTCFVCSMDWSLRAPTEKGEKPPPFWMVIGTSRQHTRLQNHPVLPHAHIGFGIGFA